MPSLPDALLIHVPSGRNLNFMAIGVPSPDLLFLRFWNDKIFTATVSFVDESLLRLHGLVRILDEIPGQFPVLPALIQRLNTDPSLFP